MGVEAYLNGRISADARPSGPLSEIPTMALFASPGFHSLRTLSGPNIWSHRPVLEWLIDTSEWASVDLDVAEELFESQGLAASGESIDRLDGPAAIAEWFAAAVVRVQRAGQCPVSFHTQRPTAKCGEFLVAFEYEEEPLGIAAAELVWRWLHSLAFHEPINLLDEWEAWRDLACEVRLDSSTEASIGNDHATDRLLTRQLLDEVGIPRPLGRLVRDVEDACVAAHRFGWPVILRSLDDNAGDSASPRLASVDEVRTVYSIIRRTSERVVVERFVEGNRYHLLVENGRFTTAQRRELPIAVGSAKADLVGDVHPRIATLASDAARVVGLETAMIDVVAQDLARSPWEQEFVVLDVIPGPAVTGLAEASCTATPSIGQAVVDSIPATLKTGRLPLVAILGCPRDPHVAERVANEFSLGGQAVGLATREGAWIGGLPIGQSQDSVGEHLRRLGRHPRTELVVVHVTLNDVLREGLPFDRCDELIETGVLDDVWATSNPSDPADLLRALECVRRSVIPRPTTVHDNRWAHFQAK